MQADHLQDLHDDEEGVEVVHLEGMLMAKVGLPLVLNELRRPKLEKLELEALDASRLSIGVFAGAERCRQAHSFIEFEDKCGQL